MTAGGHTSPVLEFYFDYVSNNAYLAWTQLAELAERHELTVVPKPVLFAGLLNTHGNVGPAEVPAKRHWMLKNILRKTTLLNVPMAPPLHHPFNPLIALRASLMPLEPAQRARLIDALFEACWVNQQKIDELDVVVELASGVGIDAQELVEWVTSSQASSLLRFETEQATQAGVFGIPSMVVHDELFFGFDDFVFMEMFLDGEDPLERASVDEWDMARMPAASMRTRS